MNMKKKETIKKKEPAKAVKVTKTRTVLIKPAVKEAKPAAKPIKTKADEAKPVVQETKLEVKPVVLRPGEVPLAIRKLLDTTNHIQARATELENALDALHEHERCRAVKDLLLALRNSPDGDLLRFDPTAVESGDSSPLKAVLEALTEAFSIEPVNELGERIPVRNGEIPDSLELDRSIGEETGECIAAEVVSVGWKIKEQIIVKPVVRPLFK
jgi:hypothetical protein